jgi:hypothetical protein
MKVKQRFSERMRLYLTSRDKNVYIAPSAGPRSLMAINDHQVTVGKQLKSHDEQLMFIIPMVAHYNMHEYCDR